MHKQLTHRIWGTAIASTTILGALQCVQNSQESPLVCIVALSLCAQPFHVCVPLLHLLVYAGDFIVDELPR